MRQTDHWRWRAIILMALSVTGAAYARHCAAQEPHAADVVQKLYREVVTRHPLGVPQGADKNAIWPLLSKRLNKAFETRNACDQDWNRKHQSANPPEKAPGVYEVGLFSGGDEEGYINGAVAGSTKAQADGSYLVYVRLWSYFDFGDPSLRTKKIYRWRVAARVISEDGHFVVDDILFLKGELDNDKSVYVSKMITAGCRGTHAISD